MEMKKVNVLSNFTIGQLQEAAKVMNITATMMGDVFRAIHIKDGLDMLEAYGNVKHIKIIK